MILYAVPLSSYCAKVRFCLALKGQVAELRVPPGGYRSAAYRQIVPAGTIPAIVDGDFTLAESDTILEYLEDRYPEPRLLPEDIRARARARYLGRLHDLHLEPRVRALFALVGVRQPDEAETAAVRQRLDLVERHLDPAGPFAAGPQLSLADCAFPATFAIIDAFAELFGWPPVWGARSGRWREAIEAHPAFASILGEYRSTVATWIADKLRGPAG
ncbi:MAG: glutathione S-transferase family protein [Rhodospirillales bacterium]|nr:glutathione S-transferase family protein [Rhodospirillales bacterium]